MTLRNYLFMLVSAAILFMGFTSVVVIEPGYYGVEVLLGQTKRTLENGFYFLNPLSEVKKINVAQRPTEMKISSKTRDLLQLESSIVIIYQMDHQKLAVFGTKYGFNTENLNKELKDYINHITKDVFGRKTYQEVIQNREIITKTISDKVKQQVEDNVIDVIDVILKDISPSNAVQKSIENKMIAEERVRSDKFQKDSIRIIAEAKAEEYRLEIDARVAGIKKVSEVLTDNMIKWELLNKWNGELPQVVGLKDGVDVNLSLDSISTRQKHKEASPNK